MRLGLALAAAGVMPARRRGRRRHGRREAGARRGGGGRCDGGDAAAASGGEAGADLIEVAAELFVLLLQKHVFLQSEVVGVRFRRHLGG